MAIYYYGYVVKNNIVRFPCIIVRMETKNIK